MKYYRVKPEDDQRKRYKSSKNGYSEIIGIYIADQLVTAKEAKQGNYDIYRMQLIETSKNNTYFCFGARFVDDESKVKICRPAKRQPRRIYVVLTISDPSAAFPSVDTFTDKKSAIGAAKFYHADGAKVVRLEKHVKEGPTTVAKHTILELTND